jgi:hypothetical protein
VQRLQAHILVMTLPRDAHTMWYSHGGASVSYIILLIKRRAEAYRIYLPFTCTLFRDASKITSPSLSTFGCPSDIVLVHPHRFDLSASVSLRPVVSNRLLSHPIEQGRGVCSFTSARIHPLVFDPRSQAAWSYPTTRISKSLTQINHPHCHNIRLAVDHVGVVTARTVADPVLERVARCREKLFFLSSFVRVSDISHFL